MTLELPHSFELDSETGLPSRYDNKLERRLSTLKGYFADEDAYNALAQTGDPMLYEVYEIVRPDDSGEQPHGVTVLYPGKVGDEYFMTKGHFHKVLETGEVYQCLKGHGMLVMETPEGETSVLEMTPGTVVYVLPRWAHRTVNVSPNEPFIFFFVYPGHAGHNYQTITERGFRKLVVERDGQPQVADNPRWEDETPS